jgi:hypothetical protein
MLLMGLAYFDLARNCTTYSSKSFIAETCRIPSKVQDMETLAEITEHLDVFSLYSCKL